MQSHIKLLGILHIVWSAFLILAGAIALLVFGGMAGLAGLSANMEDRIPAIAVLGGLGGIIFIIVLAFSLPGLVCGVGLIQYRSWARLLGIVLSALELFSVPFGTALGIYGLWVLLNPQSEALFRIGPAHESPARW